MMDEKRIAELRKERNIGMVSAVGEYTPAEFWEALDEIERLRAALKWYADVPQADQMRAKWEAVAAERERCAKLAENMDTTGHDGYIETSGDLCEAIAARIRRA